MGTGWRRAFCTTIPRDPTEPRVSDQKQHQRSPSPSPSPRSCSRLSFFSGSSSGGSNPSTPRLRCKTGSEALLQKSSSMPKSSSSSSTNSVAESPRITEIKTNSTTTPKSSNPSSPRSPLKLSLFKNSFKFRSSCGICLNSVKTGQGTAIYTAECGHAFHFPCIAAYVRQHGSLVCPVCNSTWKDVPLLAIHQNNDPSSLHPLPQQPTAYDIVSTPVTLKPTKVEEKMVIAESKSPRFTLKPYDDDEPLLSPTAGGRIIPIPEADEEDDDVEEFQGFFVHPKYSDDVNLNGRDFRMNNVQVRLLPEAALLSSGRGYETYAVALRVKAPPAAAAMTARQTSCAGSSHILDPTQRAPIDLVTVLDVSGSMTGGKIQMLKRAMRLVISSLGSADRLSIVAFSAAPKRLVPLRRMTAQGQRAARRIVDRLVCSQGTSVGEALWKATKVLEDRRERNPVASIMLLSDGQDERANNDTSFTHRNQQPHSSNDSSSTRFAHIEIPVHAFGFGQKAGYCQEPAEDAFAKCVGGLLSVVVQDLRIQLGFPAGSDPAEITAIYSCNGRPTVHGSASLRLGDLYAEEERELLVELRVPTSAAGTHHVMSVRCLYKDPATQEVVYDKEQGLILPITHSAVRSVASRPKIQRLRNLFFTTRAVAESRRLVEHNDFQNAHHLLASTRALLVQTGSALAEEYVRALEAQLAELHWKRQNQLEEQQHQQMQMMQRRRACDREAVDENGEPLTPGSAWRAAEKLAKVATMKKSLNRVSDLHGFENARF